MAVTDKATAKSRSRISVLEDEGPRPTPRPRSASLKPVRGEVFHHRRQRQPLSDGASASVIMTTRKPQARPQALGIFRGFVAAGCEPMKWASVRCSRARL